MLNNLKSLGHLLPVLLFSIIFFGCTDNGLGTPGSDYITVSDTTQGVIDSDSFFISKDTDEIADKLDSNNSDFLESPDVSDIDNYKNISRELSQSNRYPSEKLLIDGTVHTGYPWAGEIYEGVQGEDFNFDITDYPLTYALAAIHAALLYQYMGMDFSPNTIFAMAIRNARLNCGDTLTEESGGSCFLIDKNFAFVELQRFFPQIFKDGYENLIEPSHFETSSIATVYYSLYLDVMMRMFIDSPADFYTGNSDKKSRKKILFAAYKNGPQWSPFKTVFDECTDSDVVECFGQSLVTADYSVSIVHYEEALDSSEQLDVVLTYNDFVLYYESISALYAEVDFEMAIEVLRRGYEEIAGSIDNELDAKRAGEVLAYLIGYLPKVTAEDELFKKLCDFYPEYFNNRCL
ncbi:MAG: hypothetical protein JXR91_05500 [Deltaproteobacteria bacterium]|nr:hypothetical protein [Deltaproteobacteria bacterium]